MWYLHILGLVTEVTVKSIIMRSVLTNVIQNDKSTLSTQSTLTSKEQRPAAKTNGALCIQKWLCEQGQGVEKACAAIQSLYMEVLQSKAGIITPSAIGRCREWQCLEVTEQYTQLHVKANVLQNRGPQWAEGAISHSAQSGCYWRAHMWLSAEATRIQNASCDYFRFTA